MAQDKPTFIASADAKTLADLMRDVPAGGTLHSMKT